MLPGVFLGAEQSIWQWDWAGGKSRVRVLNVAQEIEDPFEKPQRNVQGVGEGKVKLSSYPPNLERPGVEYCHLRWSHGESGLAELPIGARLSELLVPEQLLPEGAQWGFWDAVLWLEMGRRAGEPVLIQ